MPMLTSRASATEVALSYFYLQALSPEPEQCPIRTKLLQFRPRSRCTPINRLLGDALAALNEVQRRTACVTGEPDHRREIAQGAANFNMRLAPKLVDQCCLGSPFATIDCDHPVYGLQDAIACLSSLTGGDPNAVENLVQQLCDEIAYRRASLSAPWDRQSIELCTTISAAFQHVATGTAGIKRNPTVPAWMYSALAARLFNLGDRLHGLVH